MDDLGLYLTVDPDGKLTGELLSVKRAEGEHSDATRLTFVKARYRVDGTVEQEIITFSELIFTYYAFIVDRLTIVHNFMIENYGGGRAPLDRNVYEYMMDMAQDLVETFEEEDPIHGTLTRTAVTDVLPQDDGTDRCALERASALIHVLQEIVFFQGLTIQVLDDLRNGVPLDFDEKYSELRRTEVTQMVFMGEEMSMRYYFRSPAAYYRFLLLNFISRKPTVTLCQHCGRFFVPKTRKKTLYCDRVIRDGKTCKDIGPRAKHRRDANSNKVIEEFDRARQRMYKRYERTRDFNQATTEKSLTASELYEWTARATDARDRYLAGEMSEEEALNIINGT